MHLDPCREEECRRRVRELRRKLADVRRSRETELGVSCSGWGFVGGVVDNYK